jgi:spermidine/putrescine transport system substrate-binding protein
MPRCTNIAPNRSRATTWRATLHPQLLMCLLLSMLAACGAFSPAPAPTATPQVKELVLYNWSGYMPQSVLDAFTAEYGIKVTYLVYGSQEEAISSIKAGKEYDVVIMGHEFIPAMIADSLLAPIDFQNVANFKNISANFRDPIFDRNNRHTVPFLWGTTGLIARTDLLKQPLTSWSDLWDTRYAGKVGMWPIPRDVIGIALKSLGYSANSENPRELEAALKQLLKLKSNMFFFDPDAESSAPLLIKGKATLAYGWSYDAFAAMKESDKIAYVLPKEGALLWGDNLVIPANSPRKQAAELFINFILRPEISAKIVNELYYASANEMSTPLIDPALRNNPVIFPSNDALKNAEMALPLSPEGKKLYDDIWQRFMAAHS